MADCRAPVVRPGGAPVSSRGRQPTERRVHPHEPQRGVGGVRPKLTGAAQRPGNAHRLQSSPSPRRGRL